MKAVLKDIDHVVVRSCDIAFNSVPAALRSCNTAFDSVQEAYDKNVFIFSSPTPRLQVYYDFSCRKNHLRSSISKTGKFRFGHVASMSLSQPFDGLH